VAGGEVSGAGFVRHYSGLILTVILRPIMEIGRMKTIAEKQELLAAVPAGLHQ
jgi:hypothetical protein